MEKWLFLITKELLVSIPVHGMHNFIEIMKHNLRYCSMDYSTVTINRA